jgi:pyruvate dehydrogenase E2 component (dihydrolipoamide acetyltransferase)
MKITLTLPQLGLTQTEGAVSEWFKMAGDAVKKDEPVFVVSTDKADMEIEAPSDGTMGEILIETNVTVPVGTPLAYLIVEGEESSAEDNPSPAEVKSPEAAIPKDSAQPVASSSSEEYRNSQEYIVSPRARRVARELGVDLRTVQGTGPSGRIIESDVRAAFTLTPLPSDVSKAPVPASPDARRRLLIAERMTESIRNIPAFSVALEVNAAKLVDFYESLKGQFTSPAKLTYTDLLLKSMALALQQTPILNASWIENAPQTLRGISLNLAVATDRGIASPVMADADQLSLEQLARTRASLTEKARAGRLSLAEVEKGAGTLSNLGMYRVDRFEGIITPGQSFIVSVGRLSRRPWIEGEALCIQPTLHLTVSVDHRVADGVEAAAFLERIAETIEKPYRLLWEQK